jgi:hypothetical protein
MNSTNDRDGIDNVVVTLDEPSSAFRAGTVVSGKVLVVCYETTAVRGIKVNLLGRMNIFWRTLEGGAHRNFAEVEDYLDEDVIVWAPNSRRRDDLWMFPGQHSYPFSFKLPIELPDTLEDSRYKWSSLPHMGNK